AADHRPAAGRRRGAQLFAGRSGPRQPGGCQHSLRSSLLSAATRDHRPRRTADRYRSSGERGGQRNVARTGDSRQVSLLRCAAVMKVPSYAKINWALRVVGKRADGYHDIETLFQTISLHDTLTFDRSKRLSLTCSDPSIPVDDTNLVLRAAKALGSPPVAIRLEKRIPAGGGLGGGSSNAAATLAALAKMFDLRDPLHEIASRIGSDVPF